MIVGQARQVKGEARPLPRPAGAKATPITAIFWNKDWASKEPELAHKVMVAYVKAARDLALDNGWKQERNIDLMVNTITLVTQSLATGHIVRVFGLTTALAFLPTLSLIGFFVLGATPTVMVLMTFQVLRRSSEFAIARPSREVLFTSAARQDRYKAKNFIDTFVYRTGDQVGAWFYTALTALGLGVSGTSGVGAAVSGIAIAVAIWLGWRHHRMPPT